MHGLSKFSANYSLHEKNWWINFEHISHSEITIHTYLILSYEIGTFCKGYSSISFYAIMQQFQHFKKNLFSQTRSRGEMKIEVDPLTAQPTEFWR